MACDHELNLANVISRKVAHMLVTHAEIEMPYEIDTMIEFPVSLSGLT